MSDQPESFNYYTSLYIKAMCNFTNDWDNIIGNMEYLRDTMIDLRDKGWVVTDVDGAWIHLATNDRTVALSLMSEQEVLQQDNDF